MNAGATTLQVRDTAGSDTFPLWVLYPTHEDEAEVQVGAQGFAMRLAAEAPVAGGRHPLVLLSHGGGSSPFVYRTLAEALARHGYIVALPEHPGDNRHDRSRADSLRNLRDRPRHLSLAADAVFGHAAFAGRLVEGRFAALGHSLGGYSALALAGGLPRTREGERVPTQADPRVAALVLLAPAAFFFRHPAGLREVRVPLLAMTGEHDTLTPPALLETLRQGVPDASQLQAERVPGAGHHSFLSVFPDTMRQAGFPPALDPAGFDRTAFQARLRDRVLDFLAGTLPR